MKSVLRSPLFWGGLLLRLLLLPFFGSSYLRDLFIPFLDAAVLNPGSNPWTLTPSNYFPYGSFLFAVLYVPRLLFFTIFGQVALGTTGLGIALVKLPLLASELLMFWVLTRFAPKRVHSLLLYFWLNPILLFITYLHGQLDVVAMTFCLLSLHLLLEERVGASAVAMACATLSKFHVVAIVPLFVVYLWNRGFFVQAIKQISGWLATWGGLTLFGLLPIYFASRLGYVTATSPEAFRVFALTVGLGEEQFLYLGVAVALGILGRLCISTRLTGEGLFFGSAVMFGALVLVTHTMPGWYYWLFPFLAVYYSNYFLAPRSLFWASCALYLLYFGAIQEMNWAVSPLIRDCLFTVLQTTILGMLVSIWSQVIRSEAVLRGRTRPFLIGIAGDSGTGKNRLSQVLCDLFDLKDIQVLNGDDYHKWERNHERWRDYTHLHPKANFLEQLTEHTTTLLSGKMVFHPHYDHATGSFGAPREIRPNRHLVIQGLHTFYALKMRSHLGLRIFLDPDPQIRLSWKIRRDVSERGHTVDNVIKQIDLRREDSEAHILPQRKLADWIIEVVPKKEVSREEVIKGVLPPLLVRHILWNDIRVAALAKALEESKECSVQIDVLENDIDRIVFQVEGEPKSETVASIAGKLFPNLRHLTRGFRPPRWNSGHAGIQQLVALALFNQRMKEA